MNLILTGTHVIFISTGAKDGQIALIDPEDGPKYFEKVPLLRKINPELKIFVSNGGGGSDLFPFILASAVNRTR